jgi:peptidoglycan/LPS O-acetylase OafA/YrhL
MTQATDAPPMRHLPELDGLRGIAVLLVVASHIVSPSIPGVSGVTLFFFISGFIITRMMLAAPSDQLLPFYIRRLFRLFPTLLAYSIASLGVMHFFGHEVAWKAGAATLLFLTNYSPVDPTGYFTLTWSLAVEEHFYLLFPLAMLLFKQRTQIALVLCLAICLALRLYFAGAISDGAIQGATHFRIDSIAWGCVLSMMIHRKAEPIYQKTLDFMSSRMGTFIGTALLVSSFAIRDPIFRVTLRFSVQGLALMFLFAGLFYRSPRNVCSKVLASKPLTFVGTISYSLYLWHMMGHMVAEEMGYKWLNSVPLALGVGIPCALLSYYLIETPARKFGARLAKQIAEGASGGAVEVVQPER